MELVLAIAFCECMGSSSTHEVLLFQRFRGKWSPIVQYSYEDAFSDELVTSELTAAREEVIAFCKQRLHDQPPQADYREYLTLTVIFLGNIPSCEAKFRAPDAMHQARWISKAIYSIKVWLFRSQFKLTQ
jgi:hypothetical protein